MIFCKRKNKSSLETKQQISKEGNMDKEEIFTFVRKFNSQSAIPTELIYSALKELNDQEQELLMVLINYKNGKDFSEKLENGEI